VFFHKVQQTLNLKQKWRKNKCSKFVTNPNRFLLTSGRLKQNFYIQCIARHCFTRDYSLTIRATNQGVGGSNPSGRAIFKVTLKI